MIDAAFDIERDALWLVWTAGGLAAAMALFVIGQRIALAVGDARLSRVTRRYGPLLSRAVDGDPDATRVIVTSPPRDRRRLARLLLLRLIPDRSAARILATRTLVQAMSLEPLAARLLVSRWWWRRALGLQVAGLLRGTQHTAAVIKALEDPNPDVRNAALDALADMQDPAALPAIVVHLHDGSLDRGRRLAAVAAFGAKSERLLLNLAEVDAEHRADYALALALCGTALSRPVLSVWSRDARVEVRAAALEALSRIGLDEQSAPLVLTALESPDVAVRASAAAALQGWTGPGDAATRLSRHLDDAWAVAVRAGRSLRSMSLAGRRELERLATRSDLAGALARRMLWRPESRS
jgi:HEAT repeat protein